MRSSRSGGLPPLWARLFQARNFEVRSSTSSRVDFNGEDSWADWVSSAWARLLDFRLPSKRVAAECRGHENLTYAESCSRGAATRLRSATSFGIGRRLGVLPVGNISV